jgi:hypothetical protein
MEYEIHDRHHLSSNADTIPKAKITPERLYESQKAKW